MRNNILLGASGACIAVMVLFSGALTGPSADETATVGTLLEGVLHRADMVDSAELTLGLAVLTSEPYRQAKQLELRRLLEQYGRSDVLELLNLDIACARISYDERTFVWHRALLNDSGWDWWGIGDRWGLMGAKSKVPDLGTMMRGGATDGVRVYTYDLSSGKGTAEPALPKHRTASPVGDFERLFVKQYGPPSMTMFREQMAPRHIGRQALGGIDCEVVCGFGTKLPPKGIRRLWIAPDKAFGVVRMEHLELGPAGKPVSCSVQTADDFVEVTPGFWLPMTSRIHHFGVIDGQFQWEWTKQFFVVEPTLNQPVEHGIGDYMFPAGIPIFNRVEHTVSWDGGESVKDYIEDNALVPPDHLLEGILAHQEDLEGWFAEVPEE